MGWHFGFLEKKKPTSFNVVTSSWVKYVPSYIGHKKDKMGLPIAYFFLVPPRQQLWHHNKTRTCGINCCTSCNILITNITRSKNVPLCSPWNIFCLAIMFGVLLQYGTLGIGLGVTFFNMPNIITTKAFQHLLAIMNDNWEALLWTIGLPYISIGCRVVWSEFDS